MQQTQTNCLQKQRSIRFVGFLCLWGSHSESFLCHLRVTHVKQCDGKVKIHTKCHEWQNRLSLAAFERVYTADWIINTRLTPGFFFQCPVLYNFLTLHTIISCLESSFLPVNIYNSTGISVSTPILHFSIGSSTYLFCSSTAFRCEPFLPIKYSFIPSGLWPL